MRENIITQYFEEVETTKEYNKIYTSTIFLQWKGLFHYGYNAYVSR